jgi:hypothetical protein
VVRVQLRSNLKTSLPLGISCDIAPIKPADGILYAGLLLTGLYVLITIDVSFAYLILYMASVALLGICPESRNQFEFHLSRRLLQDN